MAFRGNGTSSVVAQTSGIASSTITNYSWHLWYRNASAPANATPSHPFTLHAGAPTTNITMTWDHTDASFRPSAHHLNSDATYTIAKWTTALLANTWYALGATWDGSNLRAYLNGAVDTTTASAKTIVTTDTPIMRLLTFAGASEWDDGDVAEFGFWKTALTTAEMASLALGFTPPNVRPAQIAYYLPCVREPVAPYRTGDAFTATDVTVDGVDHPRVIEGYSSNVRVHIAGALFPALEGTFSSTLNLASAHDLTPEFSNTLNLASAFDNPSSFDSFSSQLFLASRFTGDSGDLANGRFKERSD